MSDKKSISFKVKNIGPHNNFEFEGKIDDFKIGVYAKNGVGKTFLSRMFRLLENPNSKKSSELLSYGEKEGYFEFKFEDNKYILNLTKNNNINDNFILDEKSPLKFHVFNSDFISDNIEHEDYSLNDKISGYIVGKKFIDLSKEKKKLSDLNSKKSELFNSLNKNLEESKSELKEKYKISPNLTQYRDFNFNNVEFQKEFNKKDINKELYSLDEKFTKLKDMSDDLEDIPLIKFESINDINWDSILEICCIKVPKLKIPPDISNFCKNNIDFIKTGMELYKSDEKCPFCKTEMNNNSTILAYDSFINDEESKTIFKINNHIINLNEFKEEYDKFSNDFEIIIHKFNNLKSFFPDFNKELNTFNNEDLIKYIDELIKVLKRKSQDVSLNLYTESEIFISNIKNILNRVLNNNNSQIIREINEIKNERDEHIKKIKREICIHKFEKFHFDNNDDLKRYEELDSEINDLSDSIQKKEKENKISKKEKVSKSFEFFLKKFFDKKYTFDSNTFTLVFKDDADLNMNNILSEGEKSIIAFCYFLAHTHTIIDNKEEYQNLVFIIDDPISSMDYNHIYTVENIIRNLKEYFNIKTKIKYLILTHNLNFINSLNKTNCIKEKWILENGKINTFKNILLPYHSHLKDIVDVYQKNTEPSHTTPNSIRQILENICYFKDPNTQLINFIGNEKILKQNPNLYVLINDLSHGFSSNNPIPENEIINCCETIYNYINKYFPGQLKTIN